MVAGISLLTTKIQSELRCYKTWTRSPDTVLEAPYANDWEGHEERWIKSELTYYAAGFVIYMGNFIPQTLLDLAMPRINVFT